MSATAATALADLPAGPVSRAELLAPPTSTVVDGQTVRPALAGSRNRLQSSGSFARSTVERNLGSGYSVAALDDSIDFHPLGVAGSSGKLFNPSAVLFKDSLPGTDMIVRPGAAGLETYLQANSTGPASYSWKVDLDPHQTLVPIEAHRVALVDFSTRDALADPNSQHPDAGSGSTPAPPSGGNGLPATQLAPADPRLAIGSARDQLSASFAALTAARSQVPDGRIIGVFTAPWSLDAAGNPLPLQLLPAGRRLSLIISPSPAAAYPLTTSLNYDAAAAAAAATRGTSAPGEWQRGLNLVSFLGEGYRAAGAGLTGVFDKLRREGGTGTVVLTPTDYVTSTDPAGIEPAWVAGGITKNESDGSVREAACAARVGGSAPGYGGPGGYSVALKPHIDVTDGTFRGNIDPQGSNLATFWAAYRQLILQQARLAIEIRARTLVVGTELTDLTDDPADTARWRALIADVHSVSERRYKCAGAGHERPKGPPVGFDSAGIKLTFAANWDAIDKVRFWDDLDLIGTDFYEDGENMAAIEQQVAEEESSLAASGAATRPFVFTEIGYDGYKDPAGYDAGSAEANRAAMYTHAFNYWLDAHRSGEAPWFQGFWWWDRYAQSGEGDEYPAIADRFTPAAEAMNVQCAFQCPALVSTGN